MAGPFWLAGNQGRVEGGQQLGRCRLLVDAFAAQMWAGPSLDFANPSLVCGHSKLGVRMLMPVERRVDLCGSLSAAGSLARDSRCGGVSMGRCRRLVETNCFANQGDSRSEQLTF